MAQCINAHPDFSHPDRVARLMIASDGGVEGDERSAAEARMINDKLLNLLKGSFDPEESRHSSGSTSASNYTAMRDEEEESRNVSTPMPFACPRDAPPVSSCPSPEEDNVFSWAALGAPIPPPPGIPYPPRPPALPAAGAAALHAGPTASPHAAPGGSSEGGSLCKSTETNDGQQSETTTHAAATATAAVPSSRSSEGQRRPLSVKIMRSPIPALPEATYENPRPAVLKRVMPSAENEAEKTPVSQVAAKTSKSSSVFDLMSSGMKLQGWETTPQHLSFNSTQPQQMRETSGAYPADLTSKNFFRKTVKTMKNALSSPRKEGKSSPTSGGAGGGTAAETLPMFCRDSALSAPLLSSPGEFTIACPSSSTDGSTDVRDGKTYDCRASSSGGEGGLLPLFCMVLMAGLCNIDHGAIPAVLSGIQEHFDTMGYVEQSLLGSLVYVGVVSGTFLAGVGTHCARGTKWFLVASLVVASAALYVFARAESLAVMYSARFLVGFCQALPVVYLPVWVDSFAPEGKKTRWIAFSQLGSIGGSVVGYFLGGVLSRIPGDSGTLGSATSWRTPFEIQSFMLLPLVVLLACLPASVINVPSPSPPSRGLFTTSGEWTGDFSQDDLFPRLSPLSASPASDEISGFSAARRLARGAQRLLRNPLYVVITLGMSTLYFVVTGIQFWATEYMVVVLKFNKMSVVILSALCFLTAPTSGVWFGGCLCDQCGGYRQQRTAVRVATLFAGLASVLAIVSAYVSNMFVFAVLLWGALFCGSALVPVAVGILLSCVPFQQRSLSSAVSQFSYNVLGWFAAPIVSGAVMDTISTWQAEHFIVNQTKELPLSAGFTMILCVSIIGFGFFAAANFLPRVLPSDEDEKYMDIDVGLALGFASTLAV